jgi:hypothetical protein
MNKKFLSILLFAGVLSVALFSCQKHNDDPYAKNYSHGYYPLQLGRYVIYNVDSTLFIDTNCQQVKKSVQLRYSVIDSVRDRYNNLVYLINVEQRKSDTGVWKIARVVNVIDTNNMIQYVENSLRFIKLQFPVVAASTWLGNIMMDIQDSNYSYFNNWVYTYSNFKQPWSNGLIKFDNTVTVNQVDRTDGDTINKQSDPASRTFAKEVYAYNVGLVYREFTHWNYNPKFTAPIDTCIKGFKVVMRAVDHN